MINHHIYWINTALRCWLTDRGDKPSRIHMGRDRCGAEYVMQWVKVVGKFRDLGGQRNWFSLSFQGFAESEYTKLRVIEFDSRDIGVSRIVWNDIIFGEYICDTTGHNWIVTFLLFFRPVLSFCGLICIFFSTPVSVRSEYFDNRQVNESSFMIATPMLMKYNLKKMAYQTKKSRSLSCIIQTSMARTSDSIICIVLAF